MDKIFVKTSDSEMAQKLRQMNFQELPKDGNFFVFMNNGKMLFENNKDIIYTNNLNMVSN